MEITVQPNEFVEAKRSLHAAMDLATKLYAKVNELQEDINNLCRLVGTDNIVSAAAEIIRLQKIARQLPQLHEGENS